MKNPRAIQPAPTEEGRLAQYVEEIIEYNGDTFTTRNLRLAGSRWNKSSRILRDEGIIEKIREYTPLRYRLLITRDSLKAWLETRQDNSGVK